VGIIVGNTNLFTNFILWVIVLENSVSFC